MKRLHLYLTVILLCILTASCSGGELQALKDQNSTLEKKVAELEGQKQKAPSWYKSEEFAQAVRLLDEFIETNSGQLGIAKTDMLQLIRLDKVSDRYFLAAYMIAPVHPLTNNFYAIVDMEKEECAQINLDSVDYINEITYEKDFISFYCDGQNVINGFRDFPHIRKYDIASKKVISEYLYKSLKFSESEIRLGNGANLVGLGEVKEDRRVISFDFEQLDGTILAGGMFCPTIRTGLKQDGNQEDRTLYIDFEALELSEASEKQLLDLRQLDYITDVSIRSYKDVHDISHLAVYFKFKDVQEYSCRFSEDGNNGFMDFKLILR